MKTNRIDRTGRRSPVTFALFLGLLVAGTLAGACAGGDDPPAADSHANDEAAETGVGVEYEPAFPEDVSADELSAEDTAQQDAHSHGEEGDHDHGEDEGEHEHDGDEDHDH